MRLSSSGFVTVFLPGMLLGTHAVDVCGRCGELDLDGRAYRSDGLREDGAIGEWVARYAGVTFLVMAVVVWVTGSGF